VQSILDQLGAASEDRIAVMLYGSYARGTADQQSDVDILELVSRSPSPRETVGVNVTQYLPSHLHAMAQRGSPFVLHLKLEGRVLTDPAGVLARCLSSYRPPANYDQWWDQVRVAAGVLDSEDAADHVDGLARLGIYLLRTATYVRCIELLCPTFDVGRAVRTIGDDGLEQALALRHKARFELADVCLLRRELERLVPDVWSNEHGTVAAFAVATADRSDVAALLAGVLSDSVGIQYSALTLPPL
jgi:predicted nucleotidyltransferase